MSRAPIAEPKSGIGISNAETQKRRERRVTEPSQTKKVHPLGEPFQQRVLPHFSASLRLCVFHPIAEFRLNSAVLGLATAARSFGVVRVPAANSFTDPKVITMISIGGIVAFVAEGWLRRGAA